MIRRLLLLLGNTVLPIVIVVAAVSFMRQMLAERPSPRSQAQERTAALVDAVPIATRAEPVSIEAFGTVVAARETAVAPEVSGRIEYVHPGLIAGGAGAAGEDLVRIDAREYRLALREAESAVEQASAALELERGRHELATAEWQQYAAISTVAVDSALPTRVPQLRSAELAVEAAEIRVERARLNLSRTRVVAPFDAVVIAESVEVGQLVSPQTQLARLVATDAALVELSVPLADVGRIALPDTNGAGGASVSLAPAGLEGAVAREGRVVRVLSQLDPDARLARVVVEVPTPFSSDDGRAPLYLGTYVRATVDVGDTIAVAELPASALRPGGVVWVATAEDTLAVRPVQVARQQGGIVAISGEFAPGDRAVVSHLAAAVDGMALRTGAEEPAEGSR
jgi:RND family efflux transporter MFP subunit